MPIHAGKYKSMSLKNGGGSNTPLPHENKDFTIPIKLDKRWVIDWVSYTFSDVAYEKKVNKLTDDIDYTLMETKQNDYILNSILHILNYGQKWKSIKIHNKSVNGYKFSWFLGEFMRINFAGPKMKNGKPSTQILFSGAACREFEDDYNGSFIHLFRFLRAEHTELGYQTNENGEIISGVKLNGSFKRIDFAIDDFTGKELNI
jgi:DNA relaxase NicK